MKKLLALFSVLFLIITTSSYAQKWVDMGTKADNGAPMYWSSCDLVKNNKLEWGLPKADTIIGGETSWSMEGDYSIPFDIAGNGRFDVATKCLGKPYRMPSQREWNRLISNCDVSFYSVKLKNAYIIPFIPNINDMSWLWGTWRVTNYDGGMLIVTIRRNNTIEIRSLRPGFDAMPIVRYNGHCNIYMNRIELDDGSYIKMDLNRRRLLTSNGLEFKSDHFVQRGPTQVPAKWIDYMKLKSRINGNTIVFPLVKYSSDDEYNAIASVSPYLSSHSESIGWWSSTSDNDDNKYYLQVNGYGAQVQSASSWKNYRIRPVYDDGHKNPSKYPNDFGWLQVNVDRFAECELDIYLDDSMIGQAPYQKELKVKCGSHEVRITGSRIDEIQRNFNVGYHQTCDYHPAITSKYANITIRSIGCEIQIDGKTVGSYSWSGELEAGTYKIKVTQPCYEPHEETIHIVGGKNETFNITPNRLKKHIFNISCNADDCKVNIDGKMMNHSFGKPLSLDLEMKTTHTMILEATNRVPITISFSIVEHGIIIQSQKGLDSYNGEQSSIVNSDLDGMTVHLSKLNRRLYYGNDNRYKQRPNYKGPIMGVDKIRVNGMSIGSEIAWRNEYYWKSRFMISWSLGLALLFGNEEDPMAFYEDFGYGIVDFVGFSAGWQVFRGAGLRVTPQIGVVGYSFLLQNPYVLLGAKVSISYPLTDRFVVGVTPMIGFFAIAGIENPDFGRYTCFGVSMNLGWQKRR